MITDIMESPFYACADGEDCRWAAVNVISDSWFVCPGVMINLYNRNSWAYMFSHQPSWTTPADQPWGVWHTCEIPFVFNNLWVGLVPTMQEIALGELVSALWASFVKTGTPSYTDWPPFAISTYLRRDLNVSGNPLTIEDWEVPQCQFWAPLLKTLYYY